jgi:hypothetical protein
MTRQKVTLISWVLAAAMLGGAVGFRLGWKQGMKGAPVFDLMAAAQFSTYVSALRKTGTDAAYEDALRSSISFNSQAKARDENPSNQRMYALDTAVSLARLSALAKKRNALDEATRLGAVAESTCPATGIRDCSLSLLLDVADYIDGGPLKPQYAK